MTLKRFYEFNTLELHFSQPNNLKAKVDIFSNHQIILDRENFSINIYQLYNNQHSIRLKLSHGNQKFNNCYKKNIFELFSL
ncbi:unnamed protein product [Paramecium octaurelia]|uniref:Uncharacterized protein n=1 Tax=Paramecium octaurelia TaxID=43137 RepID=A0A8S1U388_PAROT|nr:unnamed protein product [Paramecium octaurelia]